MFDNEGTIADNYPAGPFRSGDDAAWLYGFQITCKGDSPGTPRYDQSPTTDDVGLWADVVYQGASGSMVQWMSWLQSNWSDLYDWLDALNANERGFCKYYCFMALGVAQQLKNDGRLT